MPRVWEKIAEKMKAVGASITGAKKKLSTWAKVGDRVQADCGCSLVGKLGTELPLRPTQGQGARAVLGCRTRVQD